MRVLMAQPRGFCAGVVRAIEIVERSLEKFGAPVYVRHEIVHNRHVVEKLERKGAVFVEELDEIPDGAVTIFSAHGVAQSIIDEAKSRGLPVLDATCPLVSKVHIQGKRYVARGRTLILIGHAGHPEVEGTIGQVGGAGSPRLHRRGRRAARPSGRRACRLCHPDHAERRRYARRHRGARARFQRSRGAGCLGHLLRHAASPVGGARVVRRGGPAAGRRRRNSSNSNRLREIGVEEGMPSYLIADGSELDPAWLAGVQTVGLTAGASAPEELVLDVIEALRRHGQVEVEEMDGVRENYRIPAAQRTQRRRTARRSCRQPAQRSVIVGIPLLQAARIGAYVLRQHLVGPQALSAGADAGAAVPLQPGLRRLRQDRLSGRDPEPAPVGTTSA